MSYLLSALTGIIIGVVAAYCTPPDPQPTIQKEETHVPKDAQG
jgi:hypothetical protein